MTNSPRPLFLLHQTLQLAVCIQAGSVLLAFAKPRFVRRTARWWSMIHHSRECVSTAPESNEGKLCTVVSVATEDRRFLRATRFNTLQSRSVSLCGLPLRGWTCVAPRYFHFTITALTVDRGMSSRSDIWQTDLLERWHPMTVPHWKSLSSSVRPFYCNVCLWRLQGCELNIIHLSASGVTEIAKSTHLKGCPHIFAYKV